MRSILLALAALAAFAGSAPAADGDAMRAKAAEAKGDVDKLASAETYYLLGSLKYYHGSGYTKLDLELFLAAPDRYADRLEGMNGVSGTVVRGGEGRAYARKAVRRLARDEVESHLEAFEDLGFHARFRDGKEGLRFAGKETVEVMDLGDLIEIPCLRFSKKEEDGGEHDYFFREESGELVRHRSRTTDRTGAETHRYVDYLEYEEFDGVRFALTQNTYREIEKPDKTRSFRLVRRLSIDEVVLNRAFEDDPFAWPPDPFPASLGKDGLAEACPRAFRGRDPNLAEAAVLALVRAGDEADGLVTSWRKSEVPQVAHYAAIATLRRGRPADAPPAYRASAVLEALEAKAPALDLAVKAVGHAGCVLMRGDKVVVVDAPYQKGLFGVAEPALDGTTISRAHAMLFSSARRTCFDPGQAAGLARKTGALVIGPRTVIALLRKEGVPGEQLADLTPEEGKTLSRTVAGLTVHAMRTESGEAVHNAYVIDWNGARTLHLASTLDYEGLEPGPAKGADLAFLPLSRAESKAHAFLQALGGPRFVVATHLDETPGTLTQLQLKRQDGNLPLFRRLVPLLPNDEARF